MSGLYVRREPDGFYTLRQDRYRNYLNHPHDICATARSLDELRSMCEPHWPDVDYSRAEEPT